MKFPVPKTLSKAVAPMILVNWIFGIGVVEYPIGRPRRMISASWSIINFLIYLGFLNMVKLSEITRFEGSRIAAQGFRLNSYLGTVFIATSLCLAQIRTKIFKNTFFKLDSINERLRIMGIRNDFKLLFKTQIIELSLVFAWMFITMVLGLKFTGRDFPSESARVGFIIASQYSLVFGFVVDFTFHVSIRYFGNRFRRLNAFLAEIDSSKRNEVLVVRERNDQFQRFSSVINEIHRTHSWAIRGADKHSLLYVIRESRNIHRGLCKAARGLNKAFSIQVLFSVASSFSLIIAIIYTSYSIAIASPSNLPFLYDLGTKIGAFMMITFYLAKILLIVDACNTARFEANRTGELISKLLYEAADDEDIRAEITIFSLQLIQNPLIFTASGFFTLDYSLIRGIIGSVTTYVVIMIQMRSIYEPEDVNSATNSTMLIQTNSTD